MVTRFVFANSCTSELSWLLYWRLNGCAVKIEIQGRVLPTSERLVPYRKKNLLGERSGKPCRRPAGQPQPLVFGERAVNPYCTRHCALVMCEDATPPLRSSAPRSRDRQGTRGLHYDPVDASKEGSTQD